MFKGLLEALEGHWRAGRGSIQPLWLSDFLQGGGSRHEHGTVGVVAVPPSCALQRHLHQMTPHFTLSTPLGNCIYSLLSESSFYYTPPRLPESSPWNVL